jgi:hypothetical protein
MSEFLREVVTDFYTRKKRSTHLFNTSNHMDNAIDGQLQNALAFIEDPYGSDSILTGHVAKALVESMVGSCLSAAASNTEILPSPSAWSYRKSGVDYVFKQSSTIIGFGSCTMERKAHKSLPIPEHPIQPHIQIDGRIHQITPDFLISLTDSDAESKWASKCGVVQPILMSVLKGIL